MAGPHAERREVRRLKWVLGMPYFVQGTSALVEVPTLYFIKFTLGLGDAGGQLFDSFRSGGWFLKPVWGFISDRFPILGYRRKSWFVLMAALAMLFWGASAGLALAGVRVPLVYLVIFNLAFSTYAFVDVVCDAIMVERGRKLRRVGAFVNFQWTVLALANAGSVILGGWFQEQIRSGHYEPWMVFLATGLPPLATALVGVFAIDEVPAGPRRPDRHIRRDRRGARLRTALGAWHARFRRAPAAFRSFRRDNRAIWILVLFIFFWNFSPSVGYIERSYLIDVRGFAPQSFGLILGAGGVAFFVSILCYRWLTRRFPRITWSQYLYGMVGIGVLAFPFTFLLYLDPDHPWWRAMDALAVIVPDILGPPPGWSRYEWFRLIFQTVLGFATIPAFIIPLTIAGETVRLTAAGMGYAFLTALTNVTNLFEGVVGAGLYGLFASPEMGWLVEAFRDGLLDISDRDDARTLILEMFVYISLAFTLVTVPFIELLRRELGRSGIEVRLGRADAAT